VAAPPVLEFDVDGNLLRSWGGPATLSMVGREHGIEVDEPGFGLIAATPMTTARS